jgi:hypothetical protein
VNDPASTTEEDTWTSRSPITGTIWLALGVSEAGQAWLDERVDVQQWLGHAGIVEPGYAQPIVEAAQRAAWSSR